MNPCPKCSGELDRMGCPRCDEPAARLERLRSDHEQARRDLRAGRIKHTPPPAKKQQGAWFLDQMRRHGQAQRQLPRSDRSE